MTATRPLIVGIGAACVLALGACSSSSSSSSSSGSTTGSTAGTNAGTTSAKSVLVCEVTDLSGSQGVLTVSEAGGGAAAASLVNAAGGIKSLGGAKIVIKKFDTQSNPTMGSQEANAAVSAGCKAIFGGEITDTVMAATLVTHRSSIPWVDIGGIGDAVHERGFNDVFQLLTTTTLAEGYMQMLQQVASDFHLSHPTIGLSVSDTTYGQDFYSAWTKLNASGQFKVVSNVSYPLGTTDMSSVAARMVSQKPDILFNMGYPPDGIALTSLFKKTFHTTAKAFLSTAEAPVAMQQLGSLADGQLFENTAPPTTSTNLTAFNNAYKTVTGQEPSIEAWEGYTAVEFIAAALDKAGSTSGAAVATAMHSVTLNAANGNIYPTDLSFASDGVLNAPPTYWQQDQVGKLLFVYPASLKQASLIPYS
jgi:branched-chain amino acid transport system substrate-binding protein